MTAFDYSVLCVIGISVLLGLMRGFIRECIGLAGWAAALFLARSYAVDVAAQLPASIPNEGLRMVAGFIIVFFGVLLVASLIAIALSELFKQAGIGWIDRGLGAFYGFARGLLIVAVLVLLGGMTTLPQDVRWRNAMFSAPLEAMIVSAKPWLPNELTRLIKFD